MEWIDSSRAMESLGHVGPLAVSSEFQGLEFTGWPDETWLLHPMYRSVDPSDGRTYHDLFQQSARASVPPGEVGDKIREIMDREGSVLIGARTGLSDDPGAEWQRIRWSEFLDGGEGALLSHERPPSYDWFPFKSWPMSMLSPVEGSLDLPTLRALFDALKGHTIGGADSPTYFLFAGAYAEVVGRADVALAPLSELWWVIDEHAARGRHVQLSPHNMWSQDGSWFTYTDIDLMATKVCGEPALVAGIRSNDFFETLDWVRPESQG